MDCNLDISKRILNKNKIIEITIFTRIRDNQKTDCPVHIIGMLGGKTWLLGKGCLQSSYVNLTDYQPQSASADERVRSELVKLYDCADCALAMVEKEEVEK